MIKNPWSTVPLTDYEEHMKLSNVYQLQTLNEIMNKQISAYEINTLAILGIAGGNGLEHIDVANIDKVYGIDINQSYLDVCTERYSYLKEHLELMKLDLLDVSAIIPKVDLIIANLLIEYIDIDVFARKVSQNKPAYVSCVIQINSDSEFISSSPYANSFTELTTIHTDVDKMELIEEMNRIKMNLIYENEVILPNKKKLVRLDFNRA